MKSNKSNTVVTVLYLVLFETKHQALFFFNDTATTDIYTLSLHDALPIYCFSLSANEFSAPCKSSTSILYSHIIFHSFVRSEEHTSELQSLAYLVCRLLLEKKKVLLYNHLTHTLLKP